MADLLTNDIVIAVRNKLSDTAFDQTMIIDNLNAFIAEIYHNTRTRRMETNDQIFVSANDTAADYPNDIDIMIDLAVVSPNFYDLSSNFVEYGSFMKLFPKWQSDVAKAIQEWTDFGAQIRFSAPALTDTTINIDYARMPTQASVVTITPTDTVELDQSYKELAVTGTVARCMEANEDYAEASSERNNLAPLVTAWIRNEARGFGAKTGPIIMRSGWNNSSKYNRNRVW